VPVWHELTKEARESGKLVLLGVIQEQHSERCRLYTQWQEFDWTIAHDPINRFRARAVPYFVAIDEAGIVVGSSLRADELDSFLSRPTPATIPKPGKSPRVEFSQASPSKAELLAKAISSKSFADWLAYAEHLILWEDSSSLDEAVRAYREAIRLSPESGHAHFGLGVALRMRHEAAQLAELKSGETRSKKPLLADFQAAVDAWDKALELDPNQYIYRRRIQQYGPRLSKPYPFYDWVPQAIQEISERGQTPIKLVVEPSGAEFATPSKSVTQSSETVEEPDPRDRITQDTQRLIEIETVAVPGTILPGQAIRLHVQMQPTQIAHWNNESDPVEVWLDVPSGFTASAQHVVLLKHAEIQTAESSELRRAEIELKTPESLESTAATGNSIKLDGYALYYVCEESGGQCLYLRQDFTVEIRFKPAK
jgi:tetratricopeptide (TPR) repeat protein